RSTRTKSAAIPSSRKSCGGASTKTAASGTGDAVAGNGQRLRVPRDYWRRARGYHAADWHLCAKLGRRQARNRRGNPPAADAGVSDDPVEQGRATARAHLGGSGLVAKSRG